MTQTVMPEAKVPRTPMDPELRAISRCQKILAELPPQAQGRVLRYLANRALDTDGQATPGAA